MLTSVRTKFARKKELPPLRKEKAPAALAADRLSRITKLMALAVRFEELLRQGTAKDYADLARLGGVSRARITQVMNLRNLAPVLQEKILSLPQDDSENSKLNECALRRITGVVDWREQLGSSSRLYGNRVLARILPRAARSRSWGDRRIEEFIS